MGESAKPGANRSVTKLHCAWNPPDELKAKDFREYFSKYGVIKEVEIPKNKETGESKHFAFITFDDYDIVDKIIASGKKAIQENARNCIIAKSEGSDATGDSKDAEKTVDTTEEISPKVEQQQPKEEKEAQEAEEPNEKQFEVEAETPEKEVEATTTDQTDATGPANPESSIILSNIKPKDLINQHVINGVTCRVNKGFTNDEMK